MAKLESVKIKLYPTAFRGKTSDGSDTKVFDPQSRLFTEENITRNYTALCSYNRSDINKYKGSFVISESVANNFEFVISGYYFKIVDISGLFEDTGNYYARIRINHSSVEDPTNTNLNVTTLKRIDAGDESLDEYNESLGKYQFEALEILKNPSTYETGYDYLFIVQNPGSGQSLVIPVESKLKFKKEDIYTGTSQVFHPGINTPRNLDEYLETNDLYVRDNAKIGNNPANSNGDKLTVDAKTQINGSVTFGTNPDQYDSDKSFTFNGGGDFNIFGTVTIGKTIYIQREPYPITTLAGKSLTVNCPSIFNNGTKHNFPVTFTGSYGPAFVTLKMPDPDTRLRFWLDSYGNTAYIKDKPSEYVGSYYVQNALITVDKTNDLYEIDYPGSSNGKRYYGTTDNLSNAFTGDVSGQEWRDQVDEYNKIGIKYEETGAIELSFTR